MANGFYLAGFACFLLGMFFNMPIGIRTVEYLELYLNQHPFAQAAWHNWPLTVGTFLYLWQAAIFGIDRSYTKMGMFIGYAFANVCIIGDSIKNRIFG